MKLTEIIDTLKPKDEFLKDIEDSIDNDSDNAIMKERLEHVKVSLLERVNQTAKQKKLRRSSVSSISSLDGRKRLSSESEYGKADSVRHKPSVSPMS